MCRLRIHLNEFIIIEMMYLGGIFINVSIRLLIKTMYEDLSPTEQSIADYIMENTDKIGHQSISELANELDIADSTIFQFTKKLGFSGFKDFKIAMLIQESDFMNGSIPQDITEDDTELSIAHKVFESNIVTLTDTSNLLIEEDLKKAARIINNTNRLYLFGLGGSEVIAADGYHKFLRSSINVFHSTDYHIQLMEASQLSKDDCAIIISHSGRTKETIAIAHRAKEAQAKIIVITSHANSSLAKLGDVVFLSISSETEYRSEALASRIAQLSIIDSLYVIFRFNNKDSSDDSLSKVRRVISDLKE